MIASCANCGTPFEAIGADHSGKENCTKCSASADVFELRGQLRILTNTLERANKSNAGLRKKLSAAREALQVIAAGRLDHEAGFDDFHDRARGVARLALVEVGQ